MHTLCFLLIERKWFVLVASILCILGVEYCGVTPQVRNMSRPNDVTMEKEVMEVLTYNGPRNQSSYKKYSTGDSNVRQYAEVAGKPTDKRLLVLLSGHMRRYRKTLPTLRDKVLIPNNSPVVIASYEYDGQRVLRGALPLDLARVNYDEVVDILYPFVRVVEIVHNIDEPQQMLRGLNIVPGHSNYGTLMQLFIVERCVNATERYLPGAFEEYGVILRVRPDLHVLGETILYRSLALSTSSSPALRFASLYNRSSTKVKVQKPRVEHRNTALLNYTCDTGYEYTTEWNPSREVLVTPHHPYYYWEFHIGDHTFSLSARHALAFFRIYTKIMMFPDVYMNRYRITEDLFLEQMKEMGLRHVLVPGWHVVLRDPSVAYNITKTNATREWQIFGVVDPSGITCPTTVSYYNTTAADLYGLRTVFNIHPKRKKKVHRVLHQHHHHHRHRRV